MVKRKISIAILFVSVLLIVVGGALILTGNNKSLVNNKDSEKKESNEQEQKLEEIFKKKNPLGISEDEIKELILEKKNNEYPDEKWSVGSVEIVGHDIKDERLLVTYYEVHEDESIIIKQTIVSVINGEKVVELPGWAEGERDLTVYNFVEDGPKSYSKHEKETFWNELYKSDELNK